MQGSAQNSNFLEQISSSTEQLPTSEQLSRNSSLHSSFRSSPVPTFAGSSANQNPFSDVSLASAPPQFASSSRPIPARALEPATPQNTPANVSFPGFVPYANRDLPASNLDKDIAAFKSSNQPEELSRSGIVEPIAESANKPSSISGKADATSFTPISAAKVTEKLEHLLAEQQEDSLCKTVAEASRVDEIAPSVAAELTKSFESRTLQATNESIDKPFREVKPHDAEEKIAEPKNNTWSDVFLGQEPATQSVICPEVHTADNNPAVTDIQAVKSNAHPAQQLYQTQPISMPSSTFCTNKPADQKSSLNYVSPFPQESGNFYSQPKPTEHSTNIFFESAKPDPSSSFQSREGGNADVSFGRAITEATNNSQQPRENSFIPSSVGINVAAHVPLWSAGDQSSQSQVLNTASSQPYIATGQLAAPVFYNPAQFTNESSKQAIFPHAYDQHSLQQQSYQNPPFYGNTGDLQQSYVTCENNTVYAPPVVSMVTSVPEPTGSATLNPVQMSVNSPTNRTTPDTVPPSFQNWVRSFTHVRVFPMSVP